MLLRGAIGRGMAGGASKLRPQDVFAATLFAGTGGSQTISTGGVDLAAFGGLTWLKARTASQSNYLTDTVRGGSVSLISNGTAAEASFVAATFNSSNYVGSTGSSADFVSWAFRRAPKYFDIVTWVGDGVDGREIPHSLGAAAGLVIIKDRSAATNWFTWHLSGGSNSHFILNSSGGKTSSSLYIRYANEYLIKLGSHTGVSVNSSGNQYVAYVFAHDPSPDGVIQCGSITTDANGDATADLGWKPQFVIVKPLAAGDWNIFDTARGWKSGTDAKLNPSNNLPEFTSTNYGGPTDTGLTLNNFAPSSNTIYLAIREPI